MPCVCHAMYEHSNAKAHGHTAQAHLDTYQDTTPADMSSCVCACMSVCSHCPQIRSMIMIGACEGLIDGPTSAEAILLEAKKIAKKELGPEHKSTLQATWQVRPSHTHTHTRTHTHTQTHAYMQYQVHKRSQKCVCKGHLRQTHKCIHTSCMHIRHIYSCAQTL